LEQDTLEVDAPAGSEASSNPPEASALDKTQTLDETQPQDDGFQKAAPKTQAQIQETEDKLLSELDEYFKDEPFAGQDPGAPFLGSPVPEGFSPGADSPPDSFLGDTSFEWKFSETALNGEEPQEESGQASDPSGKDKSQVLILDEELPPPPDPDSEIGQLRNLLLERELRQLNRIASVMGDSQALAGTISQVVTEAILLRSHRDDKLNTVLAPTVEKIVSSSVRRNPEALANQIFPVIGPAIRKSISDSFSSMLQSFNNTLEMSLSLKGLKWRLEALRVHKPFSEIVLLHTLVYHVEEVYLIHAESGLILDHMVAEGGEARDTELVAAMFTAIRDFIRDSFSVDQKENLDNLRFGERTIYLLRADEVFMAAVVRGNPPAALTTELQAALELMVVDAANDLSEFKGEAQPFKKYRTFFEHFLVARYQDPKTIPFLVRKAPFIAILLVLIFLGTFWYENRNMRFHAQTVAETNLSLKALNGHSGKLHEKRITEILTRLNIVPGLAVGNVTKLQGGVLEIVCFKDELAPDPGLILTSDNGLKEGDFNLIIKPFVSMDPQIVLQRVEKAIPLPEGVSMNYNTQTGALTLAGEANLGWIISTRERALAIPGVNSLDFSNLTDPRTSQMQDLVNEINGVVIHFPLNKADPVPEDVEKLNRAVDNLAALERLCAEMQISVSLVIYGHADAIGQARRNYELSMERSFTVAALLYAKGSFMPIRNYGLGSRISGGGSPDSPDDPQEDPDMRRIELKVLVGSENTDPMAHISR
jgi:OOP family OmpA-OmpF porin